MFKLQKISALNLLLALFLSILVGCAGSKPPTDESIEAADPDDYAEIERIAFARCCGLDNDPVRQQ